MNGITTTHIQTTGGAIVTPSLYRGWFIYDDGAGSQNWRAVRFGVSMRSNSVESVRAMVDAKYAESERATAAVKRINDMLRNK